MVAMDSVACHAGRASSTLQVLPEREGNHLWIASKNRHF